MWYSIESVLYSILTLLVQLAHPLGISQDTLQAIKHNKYYPEGYTVFEHYIETVNYPNLSLTRPTGAIRLARLEYQIHSVIMEKITFLVNQSSGSDFTRSVLEYVQDYNATASSLIQSGMGMETFVKSVAGNMIAVYRMVRRFRNYIQPWILQQKKRTARPFQREVLDAINPSGKTLDFFISDFHLSMIPIIMTQFFMDWKSKDICQGTIQGMELGSTFQAVHCLEIGVHAIASGMYPIGIEWVEEAAFKAHQNDTSVHKQFAMDMLGKAYEKHDERWRPRNLVFFGETFYQAQLNDSATKKDRLPRKWQKEVESLDETGVQMETQEIERFSLTCQNKIKQPMHLKSKLFCWLETYVHPTWRIGPLKAELISGFPDDMVLFHDVVSKSLTKDVIGHCEPLLYPAKLYSTGFNPKTRLSSNCVFSDPTIESRLDGLTERLTGLRAKHTAPNTISSFPAGGHTHLHWDLQDTGGEYYYVATVIYYLEAAEIGGGIGFPRAQVHLKPSAGSAIFLYHMFTSGVARQGAVHGSCPVVQGQKWIATKFLDYLNQTHIVCDTDEYSRFEYLVNGRTKYTCSKMLKKSSGRSMNGIKIE